MRYSDVIENNIVSDTKTSSLRCIPINSKVRSVYINSTGQYIIYQSPTNLHLENC